MAKIDDASRIGLAPRGGENMVLCTEIIKRVDIPASLPPLEQLSHFEGNIILKNVVAENEGLRVTGDLVWRGFFPQETGNEECLWEGAEFFSHLVDLGALRDSDTFLLDPRVTALVGEAMGNDGCRLTFSILWADATECATVPVLPEECAPTEEKEAYAYRREAIEAPLPVPALDENFMTLNDRYEEIAEKWSDTLDILEAGDFNPAKREEEEVLVAGNYQGKEMMMERESLETPEAPELLSEAEFGYESGKLEEAEEMKTVSVRPNPDRSEVGAIKYSDTLTTMEPLLSEPFKLRYYRVQWGEDLSAIAERLSASIAKIKEINTIEEEDIKVGTVLRIP